MSPVRWSRYFLPTLKEDPKDSEAVSHKLMARAGMIRRLGSGAYSYLPFGLRALQRVAAIVREEMNRAGAQEVLLPALQPMELWRTTGRDKAMGDVLIRFKDRAGKEVALGPTHEEVITDLAREMKSHKQLPVTLYQIQTKFRDEPRPRFGIIRSKEFLMKDAYSFDADAEGLARSYRTMYEAYERIFRRCGVRVIPCEADTGAMGGDVSHEFMAPTPHGEDRVVRCPSCGYAANLEAARCAVTEPASSEPPAALTRVDTPGLHTVEQVSRFLKVGPERLIKTLVYDVADGHAAVLVRGDHDVNETKLARLLKTDRLRLSGAATIERLTGAPVGFAGPVGLKGVRLIADFAAMRVANAVTGANANETHLTNVNPGRDFQPDEVADVRFIAADDPCPSCGATLEIATALEVGHVFKLGTKYSQALEAVVQTVSGAVTPMVMGCYGIGVNRVLAAAIEHHHDKDGIVWPVALAPFDVIVVVMEAGQPGQAQAGEAAAAALEQAGRSVLLDDRDLAPGRKLKDADLIGIPVQVILGKTWQKEGKLEVRLRANRESVTAGSEGVVEAVHKLIDKAGTL